MAKRPIVHIPQNVLIEPAKPVKVFDEKLKTIIEDMTATLKATRNPKGVGLAAVQVGIPLRIFLTRPTEKAEIRTFINPEILTAETIDEEVGETNDQLEGCLSIPQIWGQVHRSPRLVIRFQDVTGATHEESVDGFLAVIIQHETDHCNGILFTRRVVEQNGRLYQSVFDAKGKEELEEIHLG